jgi:hypothetical protein
MLEEFIDFCTEVFPSINPYTVENVKSAMAQFQHEGKTFSVCRSSPLDYLAQGDIFSELPFTFFDRDGRQKLVYKPSILLSNTCDASRRDYLLFAAISDIETEPSPECEALSAQTIEDIKFNRINRFLYLPCTELERKAVDFELVTVISREAILKMMSNNKLKKNISLNEYGFYMLLSKLTVFFCRRQDAETEKERKIGITA